MSTWILDNMIDNVSEKFKKRDEKNRNLEEEKFAT
jgi:hypothetical protein